MCNGVERVFKGGKILPAGNKTICVCFKLGRFTADFKSADYAVGQSVYVKTNMNHTSRFTSLNPMTVTSSGLSLFPLNEFMASMRISF